MPKGRPFKEGELCIVCGKNDRPYISKGMCSLCYQREYKKNLKREGATVTEEVTPKGLDEEESFRPPDDGAEKEKRPGTIPNPSDDRAVTSENPVTDKIKNFFGVGGNKKDNFAGYKTEPMKTKEVKPGKIKGRVSAADSLGDIWNAAGGLLSRFPAHIPSGKLLQFQSQAAGEILDEALKDTVIDRLILQRAVKTRGKFDTLGAVLLPPVIVFMIESNPERAPMLFPILESSLRSSLPLMVPAIKKARKKEADQAEAIRELFPDAGPGDDPISELINELFGSWVPTYRTTNEEEMEEENAN